MPKTILGKWSVRLIIVFFLLFETHRLLVISGQRGGATFFSNPLLAIPGLLMVISGIAAFFAGMTTIIKNKERAVLVFIATVIGFFILIFCLGEIILPH